MGFREPQNVLHGLVPAEILKEHCDQHSIKEFINPDKMTHDHPHRERSFQNFALFFTAKSYNPHVCSTNLGVCSPVYEVFFSFLMNDWLLC